MARERTIDCDLCGTRIDINRGKEALFETDNNRYHVMDLCPQCLDTNLKEAESVNDTDGTRQKAAALIKLPGRRVPDRRQQ